MSSSKLLLEKENTVRVHHGKAEAPVRKPKRKPLGDVNKNVPKKSQPAPKAPLYCPTVVVEDKDDYPEIEHMPIHKEPEDDETSFRIPRYFHNLVCSVLRPMPTQFPDCSSLPVAKDEESFKLEPSKPLDELELPSAPETENTDAVDRDAFPALHEIDIPSLDEWF